MHALEFASQPTRSTLQGSIPGSTRSDHPEIVYLVDDDDGVRKALSGLLEANGKTVESFSTGSAYLSWRRADSAACLILEMTLPDMSGLELQRRLSADAPPAIFISGRASIQSAVLAMKGGAFEFLTKPVEPYALDAAVNAAIAHDRQQRRIRLEKAAILQRFTLLTPREREVLPLLVSGLLNKQVAVALGVREVTVQAHRGQIMRKMLARSFAELVRMAEKIGIPNSGFYRNM